MKSAAEGGDLTPLKHEEGLSGMQRTTIRDADMTGAKVSANLIVQTDLTDCILRNASFRGANLSMSNLTGCDLEGADFSSGLFGFLVDFVEALPRVGQLRLAFLHLGEDRFLVSGQPLR